MSISRSLDVVLSAEDVTERQALLTSALMDARMGRYLTLVDELAISHRALTEQVRVLRECAEFYADYNNLFHQDYGLRARRALAALDGEVEPQS